MFQLIQRLNLEAQSHVAHPSAIKQQLVHVNRPSIMEERKGPAAPKHAIALSPVRAANRSSIYAITEAVNVQNIRSAATNTMRGVGEWLGVAGSAQTLENWRQVHERNVNTAVGPGAQGGRLNNAYGE